MPKVTQNSLIRLACQLNVFHSVGLIRFYLFPPRLLPSSPPSCNTFMHDDYTSNVFLFFFTCWMAMVLIHRGSVERPAPLFHFPNLTRPLYPYFLFNTHSKCLHFVRPPFLPKISIMDSVFIQGLGSKSFSSFAKGVLWPSIHDTASPPRTECKGERILTREDQRKCGRSINVYLEPPCSLLTDPMKYPPLNDFLMQ